MGVTGEGARLIGVWVRVAGFERDRATVYAFRCPISSGGCLGYPIISCISLLSSLSLEESKESDHRFTCFNMFICVQHVDSPPSHALLYHEAPADTR